MAHGTSRLFSQPLAIGPEVDSMARIARHPELHNEFLEVAVLLRTACVVRNLRRARGSGVEVRVIAEDIGRGVSISPGIAVGIGVPLIGLSGKEMRKSHEHH